MVEGANILCEVPCNVWYNEPWGCGLYGIFCDVILYQRFLYMFTEVGEKCLNVSDDWILLYHGLEGYICETKVQGGRHENSQMHRAWI